ncbi:MAG: HNH endonuclease signature motif containing protein [Pseudomonadota bacterium]
MKYWWVNHKQTHAEEIEGGFLWSPQAEQNGARSQFYDNMRSAQPGDMVCSYAFGLISYVGRVASPAIASGIPESFGKKGDAWGRVGWLLPVSWSLLKEPIRPKDVLDELGPLLPPKYSPIQASTGNGNQKAYLAEVRASVFELLFGRTYPEASSYGPAIDLEETEATAKARARRGQAVFRQNVFSVESCCRFTGISEPWLLTASHIKPWRLCASGCERLDGQNGLLLPPHIDLLFDRGFICIEGSQAILSAQVDQESLSRLGLEQISEVNLGQFTDRQMAYLKFHREHVFKGD